MAEARIKVSLRGVAKSFAERGKPKVDVLHAFDLDVLEGEIVCLLGPSGCGKTTLLDLCAGFERPDAGRITVDGQPVTGPDPRRVFVFQERGIFPWMTASENIAFGLRGKRRKRVEEVVERYIALMGLDGFGDAYPHELSGGMKQRVEVARALAVDPDILFMDEPFGSLDSLTRLKMRSELIRIWQAETRTILFVTHDVDESVQIGQRVVVMSERPARIRKIVDLSGLPHPRDLDSREYLAVRDELFAAVGVPTRI